jgi:hypothetical protein
MVALTLKRSTPTKVLTKGEKFLTNPLLLRRTDAALMEANGDFSFCLFLCRRMSTLLPCFFNARVRRPSKCRLLMVVCFIIVGEFGDGGNYILFPQIINNCRAHARTCTRTCTCACACVCACVHAHCMCIS